MNKKTISMSIILVFSILFLSLSCASEPRYTAEEWEEFQREEDYQRIRNEIIQFDKEYKEIMVFYENERDKISSYSDEEKAWDELPKLCNEIVNQLMGIYVPELLDDFIYKRIEFMKRLRTSYIQRDIQALKELDLLEIEADRIKREVYREYDLYDLIIQ